MFAIGFDRLWNVTKQTHPKGLSQAYSDIGSILPFGTNFGFNSIDTLYAPAESQVEAQQGYGSRVSKLILICLRQRS